MKRTIAISIFVSSFYANAQVTFQKTYGGLSDEQPKDIQQTSDGGYVIVGSTYSFGAGSTDVYLVKTNSNGDTLWTRTFGGVGAEGGNSVLQTADGGYLIAGGTNSFGMGGTDVYLLKTDSSGNLLWTKTIGGTGGEGGNSIQQTTAGGYVIAGATTNSFGSGGSNVYLLKINANGDTLWTKTFDVLTELGLFVQQTSDGGFVITGSSTGAGGWNVYLLKTDSAGNLLWTKLFGGTSTDEGNSVRQTTDGGYLVVGQTVSFGAGGYDVYVIKTDSMGNLLWTKTFGGSDYDIGTSVQQTADGGYVIAGGTRSFGSGNWDAYLLKLDSGGNLLWTKTFGGANIDMGNSIHQTIDGGYVIAGSTWSFGVGLYDFYLIKTDSLGNSSCNESNPTDSTTSPATQPTSPATIVSFGGIAGSPATVMGSGGIITTLCYVGIENTIPNPQTTIIVSPNPTTNEITIQSEKFKVQSIEIYNVTGQLQPSHFKPQTNSIDISELTPGIYFITVTDEAGNKAVRKVVKM